MLFEFIAVLATVIALIFFITRISGQGRNVLQNNDGNEVAGNENENGFLI